MKELSAGIIFVRNEQIFLAHATETPRWDLHLFLYTGSEFPDIDKCYCTSYFFKGSRMVYEMDCFNYFDFSDIPHVTGSSMSGVLHQILKSEFNYEPL